MDEPSTRDQLRSCLKDIARLNRWFRAYRPLLTWLGTFDVAQTLRPIRILDLGCGYGDGLRRIERWAAARNFAIEPTGLDIDPDAVAIAAEATPSERRIQWIAADIFAHLPEKPVHFVVSSLFTHHLSDNDVVRLLEWMEGRAALGWFVNDLSRAAIPYHFIRAFTRLARLHPFVQHDAPASFARSFTPQDWQRMCADAGLDERDFSIEAHKPARLCVARRKTP
jgi:SAM-dependent methyltransferase